MKNKKIIGAALAATMFVSAACGLVACDKDAATNGPVVTPPGPVVNTDKVYTVTFEAGTGATLNGASTLKTDKNGIVQGTVPTASKTDHTFTGWSLQGGAATLDLKTHAFKDNTTVYASFVPVQQGETGVYTITFNYGEGSGTPASAQTANGTLSDLPTPTAPDGKTFDAWYTGENGTGTKVTTSHPFSAPTTIYANYTGGGTPVGNKNGLYKNGTLVAEFAEETAEYGSEKQYGATGVMLSAGDELIIKIDGQQLTHTVGVLELWLGTEFNPHGVYLDQTTGIFKIKAGATRAFNIHARYFTSDNVCWSIDFTDGLTDTLQVGGAYLVGDNFENASWLLVTDLYIDPVAGLVVTFNSNSQFKVCSCKSEDPDKGRDWIYNDGNKYREEGGSYLNLSGINDSDNGKASGTHTYKITIEDGVVVFTLIS